jgi:hypothetical protein
MKKFLGFFPGSNIIKTLGRRRFPNKAIVFMIRTGFFTMIKRPKELFTTVAFMP